MNGRRINQALWTLAAMLGVAAVVVVISALAAPLQSDAAPRADRSATAGTTTNQTSLPQLAAIEPLWSMRLQSMFAPDATPMPDESRLASEPSAPAPAGVPVTLVGTIGQSLAMLRDTSGAVEVRGVGEQLAGVEVLQVRPARVQVRYNGEVITLEKPAAEPEGGL
jgi:hypothetical protein